MPSKTPRSNNTKGLQAAGLGIELLGAILGFALVGYWIDKHFETGPWGLLICITMGFIGGFYNLIRASLKAFERAEGPGAGRDVE